jgi:hypothetical protein
MLISNEDLYKNQYDYETLKTNIYVVSLIDILKTQKLTSDFCVKYILNKDFQFSKEEEEINIKTIKKYQPHLLNIDIENAEMKATNKLLISKRIDSVEDFESYINKMCDK